MFHRWKKRVLREGAQAEGQVFGLTAYGTPSGNIGDFGVKVRVRLPDGSTADFEKGPLEARNVGRLQAQVDAGRQAQLDSQFDHLGEPGAASPAGGDLNSRRSGTRA
jgi:hypothetical protein